MIVLGLMPPVIVFVLLWCITNTLSFSRDRGFNIMSGVFNFLGQCPKHIHVLQQRLQIWHRPMGDGPPRSCAAVGPDTDGTRGGLEGPRPSRRWLAQVAAGCCGTFAFRPTHGELWEKDVKLVCPSLETVAFTAGSMARLQQVASAIGLPGEALRAHPTSHTPVGRACCRCRDPAAQAQGRRQHAVYVAAAPIRRLACCNVMVGAYLHVSRKGVGASTFAVVLS